MKSALKAPRMLERLARSHLLAAGSVMLAACVGTIGDGDDRANPGDDETAAATQWAPAAMSRLTAQQYANSIHDVFGSGISIPTLTEDETNEAFLSMGAAKVGTSERGVEQYHAAAIDIANQIVTSAASYPELADCAPFDPADACVDEAIAHFGGLLWRRPLGDDEVARIAAVQSTEDSDDPEVWSLGMTYALAALVASPNFIYRAEIGEEHPGGGHRYTAYEMATRLSYTIWNSTPDAALLEAASSGALESADGVRAQAERMLTLPRAADVATRFFGESWMVAGLDITDKNTAVYPEWNADLLAAYLGEFDAFLTDLVARQGDLREIFTAESSFANDLLAGVYGASASGSDFEPFALTEGRSGLLTSAAVIAAVSPSDRTSPTHRGVFVLENILCQEVPPPPPNVNDVLESPDPAEAETLRDKLEQHRTDPACASCHELMDPLGFTFEHYDAIGRYRADDNGQPIDATGEFLDETFSNVRDLAEFIAADPRMTECLSKRLYTFAAGHLPADGELDVVDDVTSSLRNHYRFDELVLDVVTSDAFRFVAPPGGEQP